MAANLIGMILDYFELEICLDPICPHHHPRMAAAYNKAIDHLRQYRLWMYEIVEIPFRLMALWLQEDRTVMTEFQRGFVIITYRLLIKATALAILFSAIGNVIYPGYFAASMIDPAKWKYVAGNSKYIRVMPICKLASFLIAPPFLLVSSRYELIWLYEKRRLVLIDSIVMALFSMPAYNQPFRDTYLLALLLISSCGVLLVATRVDTYEKLVFLPKVFLAAWILLFGSGTIFVTMFEYVSLKRYFKHACTTALFQTIHVDVTMGLFKLDAYNSFVQVLLVLLITELL